MKTVYSYDIVIKFEDCDCAGEPVKGKVKDKVITYCNA